MSVKKEFEILSANTAAVLPNEDALKKLASKKKLVIKLGADPTAPDLHLGHAIVLEKLRDLQNLGHDIYFLIGDFTARIGDPTGKSKTRPPLSEEQIIKNTKTYIDQLSKILDMSKTNIVYNSHWLDKLSSKDWIKLCGSVTLARIIEREDFAKRIASNSAIGFHELTYPLLQGYDSVVLKADIEVGGTDQTFNLMMGRYLQEQMGQEPQVVITMPLLEGLDGVQKMSKSLNNYVGLTEEPSNAYGKILSINDTIMVKYFSILLRYTPSEIETIKAMHPLEAKKRLAYEIVLKYWSQEEAALAQKQFEDKFQAKTYETVSDFILEKKEYNIVDLLTKLDNRLSKSQAKKLLISNSVSVNGKKISNFDENITKLNYDNSVIKIGKHRIFKLIFN
jgi:tyrosyl-tRNA synthetase